jgi:hypothetical protein
VTITNTMAQTAMRATTRAMMSAGRKLAALGEELCLAWVCVRRPAVWEVAAPATVAPAVANHPAAPATAIVSATVKVAANPRQFLTMEAPRLKAAWARTFGDGALRRGPTKKFGAGAGPPLSHPEASLGFRELPDTVRRRSDQSTSSR